MINTRIGAKGMSKNLLLLILAIATVILFVLGLYFNSRDRVGVGEEFSPQDGPAIINGSEELFTKLSDGASFEYLRYDLAFFGRSTIESYKSGEVLDIIFTVSDDLAEEGNSLSFSGKFKESGDKIEVVVTKLSNSRIKVSITNSKTGTSLNDNLPSNSSKNQFIGSLPKKTDGYNISYISSTDGFMVVITGNNINVEKQTALNDIKSGVGEEDASLGYITYLVWDENGNPKSLSSPESNNDSRVDEEVEYEVTEDDF